MFKNIFVLVFSFFCVIPLTASSAFARDVKVSTYSSSPEADYKEMRAESATLATANNSQVVIGAKTAPAGVKVYVAGGASGNMAVQGDGTQKGVIRTVGGLRIERRTNDAPTTDDGRIWLIEN